ncbi:hypothetical protein BDD12DRAFT_979135 [Trichophaea hybrida]|nr:hypothetical protein BDD12DRAFT_979135 [Trichophaea hybrida]
MSTEGTPSTSPCPSRTLMARRIRREQRIRVASYTTPQEKSTIALTDSAAQRALEVITETRSIPTMGIRATQAHSSRLASQVFDLSMKLHLEQEKSERLANKVDTLERAQEERECVVRDCLRQLAQMRETVQCLHEELERQDVIIDDARCINQSYQKRYKELQERTEQYQEKSSVHPRFFYRDLDCSGRVFNFEVDNFKFPKPSSGTASRIEVQTPPQPETTLHRGGSSQSWPSNQAVHRPSSTCTAGNGEDECSRSSTGSSTTRSLSPVLPEPSEDDVLSLYRLNRGYAASEDNNPITPRFVKSKWFSKFTIEEIRERTASARNFFKDAKELLGDLPSPIERSLAHPSGFMVCGDSDQTNEQQIRDGTDQKTSIFGAEQPIYDKEDSYKTASECSQKVSETSPSELSFEDISLPQPETSFTPQPDITDSWLQRVPPYCYPVSISGSQSSAATVVSNLITNPREITSNIVDLVHSPPSSPPDIWLQEALSSSTGKCPSRGLTQRRKQYNNQSQPSLTLGCPSPSFLGNDANPIARKLRLPYVSSSRKPKVTIPRASPFQKKKQLCDMRLATPSPLFSRSSWESMCGDDDMKNVESSTRRLTAATRNKKVNRRPPWLPAGKGVR